MQAGGWVPQNAFFFTSYSIYVILEVLLHQRINDGKIGLECKGNKMNWVICKLVEQQFHRKYCFTGQAMPFITIGTFPQAQRKSKILLRLSDVASRAVQSVWLGWLNKLAEDDAQRQNLRSEICDYRNFAIDNQHKRLLCTAHNPISQIMRSTRTFALHSV